MLETLDQVFYGELWFSYTCYLSYCDYSFLPIKVFSFLKDKWQTLCQMLYAFLIFDWRQIMIKLFRLTAFLEGLSFILLMGVCMPLKYIWGMPIFVKIVGMAHGILFVVYCLWVIWLGVDREWKFKDIAWSLVASVLPLGTFVAERKIFKRLFK